MFGFILTERSSEVEVEIRIRIGLDMLGLYIDVFVVMLIG